MRSKQTGNVTACSFPKNEQIKKTELTENMCFVDFAHILDNKVKTANKKRIY